MLALIVPAGTETRVIRSGKPWSSNNIKVHVTATENLFFREDIVVDPVGNLGTNRSHSHTIGGTYAEAGWYGFERDGWILLVPANKVATH